MRPLAAHAVQLLVAAAGGFLFDLLGLPAAWLTGSLLAVVGLTLLGHGRPLPRPLADAALLVSGAAMGAAVTPEALEAVGRYPLSLLALGLAVVAVTLGSTLWLTGVAGWRRDDALLASVPGALSTVLAVAVDRKADVAGIAAVQSFRLLALLALGPSAVVLAGGGQTAVPGGAAPVASPQSFALLMLGGLGLGWLLQRLGAAAPILLGSALVSTVLHATGVAPGSVPPAVNTASLVLLGMFIAANIRFPDRSAAGRLLPAAAGSFGIGVALSALFAALAAAGTGAGLADALVAFAPGALEGMVVLGLVLGLDPVFVGVHHLARALGITVALPLLMAWLGRRNGRGAL